MDDLTFSKSLLKRMDHGQYACSSEEYKVCFKKKFMMQRFKIVDKFKDATLNFCRYSETFRPIKPRD